MLDERRKHRKAYLTADKLRVRVYLVILVRTRQCRKSAFAGLADVLELFNTAPSSC